MSAEGAEGADRFDLARFLRAQSPVFEQVRAELGAGAKRSHWMWFVFPQLRGLGRSAMAQRYGLTGLEEAAAFLQHPVLGARLIECTELVLRADVASIHRLFGTPDDLKFRSCMTLFAALPAAPPAFNQALAKYFGGVPDALTLAALQTSRTSP